jgi:hypothetical protein
MSTLTLSMVGYLSDGTPIEVPITGTSDIPTLAEIEASAVLAKQPKLDTVEARLTADRAAKLDRDIAHSGDAALYRADVSALATTVQLDATEADIIAALPAAAPTPETVAAAVRTELAAELALVDAAISTLETEADAAIRHTASLAEHDATQAALGALPVPLDAAETEAAATAALTAYDVATVADIPPTIAPIYLGEPASVDVTRGVADCTPYRLAAGDDALILARLHRAGLQFDIPLSSWVTAQITMPRNAGNLTGAVAQSAGTTGADWPRSVVAVAIQDAVTAAITYRGPAEMRIRIDNAGQITTGVLPITII